MGNPKGVTTEPTLIDSGNGIFASVPGEYIATASRALPPADTMQGQTTTVETDAGHAGRVVITYTSKELRYRRNRSWSWVAMRVDPAPHSG